MPKFRKKPVVVEAVQFTRDWKAPPWVREAMDDYRIGYSTSAHSAPQLWIKTLEGSMVASPGDWIIRGVKGEIYPCKPVIFALTYEPVSEGAND
jgi:hypothetical protein